MIRLTEGDLPRYVFESFADDSIVHGVFTRLGGSSQGAFAALNVGHTVDDESSLVEANHQAIYRALGTGPENVVTAHQVHGDRVAVVSSADGGRTFADTDALVSNVPDLFLMLRFADCVPVFFWAPRQGAVGLAHAGWRGTLRGVVVKTAQSMVVSFGCKPEEIYVGVGPSIGPCCFEVGPEIVREIRAAFDFSDDLLSRVQVSGKANVDLWLANAHQLREVGVSCIETASICTCCHRDEFYSHRAENGHTGRFAALIGLRGAGGA